MSVEVESVGVTPNRAGTSFQSLGRCEHIVKTLQKTFSAHSFFTLEPKMGSAGPQGLCVRARMSQAARAAELEQKVKSLGQEVLREQALLRRLWCCRGRERGTC